MVRSSVPLSRRLRSWRGTAINVAVWLCAAFLSALLLLRAEFQGNAVVLASGGSALLVAPEGGTITSVRVAPGDRVAVGTPILTLSIPGLDQQIAGLEAQLASAGSALGAEDSERTSRLARDAERARAELAAARVAYARERALLVGQERLVERMSAAGAGEAAALVDQAVAERDSLRASLEARLAEIGALERAVVGAQARAGQDLDAIAAGIAALEAELALLRGQQEANTLRAPIAGVVTGAIIPLRDAVPMVAGSLGVVGQWVPAGTVIGQVSAGSTASATAWVPPVVLARVQPGEAVVLTRADGSRVDVSVRAVGGAVESVPAQAQADVLVPEWKVPVMLEARAPVMVPGERLTAAF